MAAPFISTMTGTLDAKGRVCIPAAFREVLSAQGTAGVYVCPSFAEGALEGFGDEVLQEFHQRQAAEDPFFSQVADDKAFAILSMSQLLPRDENGRVRIPDAMIEHAGLKDKIVFVGKAQKFQIWDEACYAPIEAEALARVKAKMERARNGEAS